MITPDGGVVKNFIELDLQEFNDDEAVDKTTSQEMIEKDVYDAVSFKSLLFFVSKLSLAKLPSSFFCSVTSMLMNQKLHKT